MTSGQDQSGFTLVEVLVAFAILSLTVITGLEIFSDGVSHIAAVEQRLADLAVQTKSLTPGEDGASGVQPAERGVSIQQSQLSAEALPWTSLNPVLIRIGREGEANELWLETIQIQPNAGVQP